MRINNTTYPSVRIWVHIAVWAGYFVVVILPPMLATSMGGKIYYAIHFLTLITATYVNTIWLMNKYFYTELYKSYLRSFIIVWLAGLAIIFMSGILLEFPPVKGRLVKYSVGASIAYTMELFIFSLYKLAKEWFLKSQKSKELEFEKVRAELNLLRSQLDAHFVFNTLNNLYLLVLNKSDKAPDAILKLSDLLSYTIYESHDERVPISKELEFIENYISLQKLRLDDTQQVYFEVEGDTGGKIEPLILFNFIENAFKHADGFVQVDGQRYFVKIHIIIQGGRLILKTANGRNIQEQANENIHEGVGLSNARKRLDLVYKDLYTLDVVKTEEAYYLTLIIQKLD